MALVAGIDFGTLNVRVTLLDSEFGRLGTSSAEFARRLPAFALLRTISPDNLAPRGRCNSAFGQGIPIPVGAFDAHWDAIGAGFKEGDVINVVGTSTCIMAIQKDTDLVPGVCGVVP